MLAKTITVICNQLYSRGQKNQKHLSESVQGPAHRVEQDFFKFQGRGIFYIHAELCPK